MLNRETEQSILLYYSNGVSGIEIGKILSIPASTVYYILRKNRKTRTLSEARNNFTKRKINENAFTEMSKNSCYWLGVMYSDGYIVKSGKYTNYFGLSVSSKDEEWLEKFKNFLGYNGKIKRYKMVSGYHCGGDYSRITIGNNKMVSDLEKLGIMEHKSLKDFSIPNIPYPMDFIRGVVDSDGTISTKPVRLRISGGKVFLTSIANCLGLPYSIYKDKTIFTLSYGKKATLKILELLYKSDNHSLLRKYNLAHQLFSPTS